VKILIGIVIGLAVLSGAAFAGWQWFAKSQAGPEATLVRTEFVGKGNLVEIVSAPGQVQPKNKVSISARVAARIVQLPYEEGRTVKKDESVLLKLDSKDLQAALESVQARRDAQEAQIKVSEARIAASRAQLDSTRVNLADAQRDLRRQQQLLESKDVSQATVDQAQSKVDSNKAQLASALENLRADESNVLVLQHNLKSAAADITKAQDQLSYTEIRSPIDGVVTRLNAKVGELVMTGTMNNAGTVIMEVADLSQMLVVARVDETSVANVQVGQSAAVRMQAYPDKRFEGTVYTVALAHTDERDGSKYFKVEILLKNDGSRIFSGLTADVDIETRRHDNVTKVPSQAVLGRPVDGLPVGIREKPEVDPRKKAVPVVYRLVNDKTVVTPVKIGASDMMHTIIESGLNAGDQIVTGPYKALEAMQHDQKVKDEKKAATTQPMK
jgi:HlyD family secretion protein